MGEFSSKGIDTYARELASASPVPGGGGTAAVIAAFGAALGEMVGSLTVGKKKYADVEEEIRGLMDKAAALREEFLTLCDRDPEVFEPLSRAYGLPKDTEEEKAHKEAVMEECLRNACEVPLELMRLTAKAVELIEQFGRKGAVIAISDAGVGASFLRSALESAALNVFINTRYMKDQAYAHEANQEAMRLLAEYGDRAEAVYDSVYGRLIHR